MADCRKCKHNYKMPGDEPRCNLMCDGESDFEPITNAEKIRSMNDEELAEFLHNYTSKPCSFCFGCEKPTCKDNTLKWLQSEAE